MVFKKGNKVRLGIKHTNKSRRKMREQKIGKNNPMYGNKHSEDSKRKMRKAETGRKRKPFSVEHKMNMGKVRMGKKNPNWNDGISFLPYDSNFTNHFKRLIRKRDNHICIKCGIHQEKLSRTLDVHHINYDKMLTIPQNCLSLCSRCNLEVNFKRKYWTQFFQLILHDLYGYEYENNKVVLDFKQTILQQFEEKQ